MESDFTEMLRLFSNEEGRRLLTEGKIGIELESQRVTSDGNLAMTPHPLIFGNKMKNKNITTDFAESQIEMITPAFQTAEEAYASLASIRRDVEKGIGNELLWPLSMPPRLPAEQSIPLARFPDSKEGRENEAYRNGLALRYGKKMQMISGIHYNFSFSSEFIDYLYERFGNGRDRRTFTDDMYFSLTRNFLRYRWLLVYLYGASPVCDPTYYSVINKELTMVQQCCPCCRDNIGDYVRYATSLRVSRFGYTNAVQGQLAVYYNSLDEYARKLKKMMETKSRDFMKLGLYENGTQKQLNGNVLQKESEFYAPIRLKQNIGDHETQLSALTDRGVKYVEVRVLDLNPFEPIGISLQQLHFMRVFMLFCLLEQSKEITSGELKKINSNHHLTALFGRKPGLLLHDYSKGRIPLTSFGDLIFIKLRSIAELLDQNAGDGKYLISVEKEEQKLSTIALLPSDRIFKEMKEGKEDYRKWGIRYASRDSGKMKQTAPVIGERLRLI